jgi:hypothetical protein
VLVLPEDDANRQIANGFMLDTSLKGRAIQVLPSPGGWSKVRDAFVRTHLAEMDRNTRRYMVLLVDFDQDDNRLSDMKAVVPERLADRVFVMGVWSNPEDLRRVARCSLEDFGRQLAEDCRDGLRTAWNHHLLQHNGSELERMTPVLRPFLFPGEGATA